MQISITRTTVATWDGSEIPRRDLATVARKAGHPREKGEPFDEFVDRVSQEDDVVNALIATGWLGEPDVDESVEVIEYDVED